MIIVAAETCVRGHDFSITTIVMVNVNVCCIARGYIVGVGISVYSSVNKAGLINKPKPKPNSHTIYAKSDGKFLRFSAFKIR